MPLLVEVANRQTLCLAPEAKIQEAVRIVLAGEGVRNAEISVAIVGDAEMHALNAKYLQHDFPTDVLSFLLDHSSNSLVGEIIVSSDTAATEAERVGWPVASELLLYVVHGCLHLCGYDDHDPVDTTAMRALETKYLALLGVQRRD